jgi:uncharacterized membrane protein
VTGHARRGAALLFGLLAVGLAAISLRYLGGDPDIAPPELRASAAVRMPLFQLHAAGAALALLLLPLQALALAGRRGSVHRWAGRFYVAGVTAGGAAALPLAMHSFAGPVSGLGFGLLACCWLGCTWAGVAAARRGDRQAHAAWMIRSGALTASAITLRVYLPLPELMGLDYAAGYRVIAWACWVPNLALASWWLHRRARGSTLPVARALSPSVR